MIRALALAALALLLGAGCANGDGEATDDADPPEFASVFGDYGSGPGEFAFPKAVAVAADGNWLVADNDNYRVQKFDPGGTVLMEFGTHGSGPGQFESVWGITVDLHGHIGGCAAECVGLFAG